MFSFDRSYNLFARNIFLFLFYNTTACLLILRPTTRECVHLLTRGRFRSRHNGGDRTIQSTIAENPMLHANFMAPCFMERELLLLMKVLHCGEFSTFCFHVFRFL